MDALKPDDCHFWRQNPFQQLLNYKMKLFPDYIMRNKDLLLFYRLKIVQFIKDVLRC